MPGPIARELELKMPRPPFLWTLDQIAMLIAVDDTKLRLQYIHFDQITAGRPPRDKITAHDIAPLGSQSEWRVSETELLRWLRRSGFRTSFGRLY